MAPLSVAFVESISTTLQSADIPCVLWGHYLLTTHGIPSIVSSIDFIVPDNQLPAAVEALRTIDTLEPCRDLKDCPAGPYNRYTPPASHHVHIRGSKLTVGIFVQSETLWFLPALGPELARPFSLDMHPHFVLASNKQVLPPARFGRGVGVFNNEGSAVAVPRAIILLEAFLRLYARDSSKKIGSFSMQMICYIEEYVDEDGYLGQARLPGQLQSLYEELKEGGKPVRQWSAELRDVLGVQLGQDAPQRTTC